jgi:hypothetical protein
MTVKVHYYVHKDPSLFPILIQKNKKNVTSVYNCSACDVELHYIVQPSPVPYYIFIYNESIYIYIYITYVIMVLLSCYNDNGS